MGVAEVVGFAACWLLVAALMLWGVLTEKRRGPMRFEPPAGMAGAWHPSPAAAYVARASGSSSKWPRGPPPRWPIRLASWPRPGWRPGASTWPPCRPATSGPRSPPPATGSAPPGCWSGRPPSTPAGATTDPRPPGQGGRRVDRGGGRRGRPSPRRGAVVGVSTWWAAAVVEGGGTVVVTGSGDSEGRRRNLVGAARGGPLDRARAGPASTGRVVVGAGRRAGACWGASMGAGSVNGVAGTPASAWLMKCLPGDRRPRTPVHRIDPFDVAHGGGLAVGVSHPHGGRQRRRIADEPGVGVVAGGAGLTGGRTAQLGGGPGAAGDDALQHLGDVVGHVGRQHRWSSPAAG